MAGTITEPWDNYWANLKPSKNELARSCKIVQESCMQDCARILHARFAWHVHAICPFSCTILAQSCTNSANLQVIILAASLAVKILHHVKIVQESCKKRDISRARAKQVLHARFLHDLASSFLLGKLVNWDIVWAGPITEPDMQPGYWASIWAEPVTGNSWATDRANTGDCRMFATECKI